MAPAQSRGLAPTPSGLTCGIRELIDEDPHYDRCQREARQCEAGQHREMSEVSVMITPEQMGERYLAFHHRMFRAVNDEMNACGMSMARTKVLSRLHEQGPTRQNVLATELELSPHSITDIVDTLERLGHAERRPGPAQRGGPR